MPVLLPAVLLCDRCPASGSGQLIVNAKDDLQVGLQDDWSAINIRVEEVISSELMMSRPKLLILCPTCTAKESSR